MGREWIDMKIAFFDTKPYDKIWFEALLEEYEFTIKFYEHKLNVDTAVLAKGCDVVCVFVNDQVTEEVIAALHHSGVRLIALRCAGYNNVDRNAAQKYHIPVVRVPSYSPTAVAEHTMALLLSVNRKTYKAYTRTRDNNFNINGLMGFDLCNKTIGIIGMGQIGTTLGEIAKGFRMRVLAHDPVQNDGQFEYVSLDTIWELSDILSLHCPLTKDTYHMINEQSIPQMKDGVVLLNTSRGALVDTEALLRGLLSGKIGGAGLDVYEEEAEYFFEDKSNEIIQDEELARLLSLPNVLVTSHQAFFTKEAMQAIAMVTMENIYHFQTGKPLVNEVKATPKT